MSDNLSREQTYERVFRALYSSERASWLDPEDAQEMAKDVTDALVPEDREPVEPS